jgi:putative spermidine/putrescine transport system substrate-binding protein
MSREKRKSPCKINRRAVLKNAAASVGVATTFGILTGFPTVWAQKIKEITLVHVGGSYSAIVDIAKKASQDLGFQIEMQTADHSALLNRLVTQPATMDIADIDYFLQYFVVGRNIIQPIAIKDYKWWDKTVPIFTKGEYPDGHKLSTQGTMPFKVQYLESPTAKTFASQPSDLLAGIPTVFNADTLGIRPDIIARPIQSWKE